MTKGKQLVFMGFFMTFSSKLNPFLKPGSGSVHRIQIRIQQLLEKVRTDPLPIDHPARLSKKDELRIS